MPDGMVGHPAGLGWFCDWHLRGARALRGRSLARAIRILRIQTIVWLVAAAAVAFLALAALILRLTS